MIDEFSKRHLAVEEIAVRWGDQDAFGHVNNTMFFRYFEGARIVFLENSGITSLQMKNGIGPILAKTSCTFIRPIFYPNTILVGTSLESYDEHRLYMDYEIIESKNRQILAKGKGELVAFDYKEQKKATIPPEWLQGIERLKAK